MKKRGLFIVSLFFLVVSLLSCKGSVGNTNTDNYKEPQLEYRLINNDTAYEIIGIEENYIGSFVIPFKHKNSAYSSQELPVISIADGAFKDAKTILGIVIFENIIHIGRGAFENFVKFQKIIFQIEESKIFTGYYNFNSHWNLNCNATIIWNYDLKNIKNDFPMGVSYVEQYNQYRPYIEQYLAYFFGQGTSLSTNAKFTYKIISSAGLRVYMITGLNKDCTGKVLVPYRYSDPGNSYGELPVIAIAEDAFKDCTLVSEMYILKNIFIIEKNVFENWNSNQKVFVEYNPYQIVDHGEDVPVENQFYTYSNLFENSMAQIVFGYNANNLNVDFPELPGYKQMFDIYYSYIKMLMMYIFGISYID